MEEIARFLRVFQAGANVQGLIRMGPATDPYAKGSGIDLVPGVGVKFLRTGVDSANFMLLHSLDPLPNNNFNFFSETVSNHISGDESENISSINHPRKKAVCNFF